MPQTLPADNRIALLVLQHPQEQDRELGTARLAVESLQNATLRIGLSWPSLAKALGRAADPKSWAVLYLGSADASSLPRGREIVALDAKGRALEDQTAALKGIEEIVILDGNWSQAKTLWWRNAWVLKCRRLALNPKQRSLYGELRREPRRQALSTIEAAALALSRLENTPAIETELVARFQTLIENRRAAQSAS